MLCKREQKEKEGELTCAPTSEEERECRGQSQFKALLKRRKRVRVWRVEEYSWSYSVGIVFAKLFLRLED